MLWHALWFDEVCFIVLHSLMFYYWLISIRKTRLITRDDIVIDWRLLYKWSKTILHNHDEPYSLVSLPKFVFSPLWSSEFFLFILFKVISIILYSIVYEDVDPIFQQQQHRKFLMNFDHIYVHLIQHFRTQWESLNCSCRFIYHRNYMIRDSSRTRSDWFSRIYEEIVHF